MTEATGQELDWVATDRDPIHLRMQQLAADWPDRTIKGDDTWVHVSARTDCPLPAQGWKLHISATPQSAPAVLERALSVLMPAGAEFKVAATIRQLATLNMGLLSMRSQVGKFITVYPPDEPGVVRLAAALHAATAGLEGPAIPSDRPLHPGSLVHYRYGAFQKQVLITPVSVIVPALREPGGRLVPDQRKAWFSPPAWAADPFVAAGITSQAAPPAGPIGTRYQVRKALQQAGKGGVYVADDLGAEPVRTVVIKEARRHLSSDGHGRDARDRLRHEYEVLRSLQPNPLTPAVSDLFEQEGNLYIVMELVNGVSLRSRLTAAGLRGEHLPVPVLLDLARRVTASLKFLHGQGIICRDFTPNNIIMEESGRLRLLDLELSYRIGSAEPSFGGFTRGYARPAREQKGRMPLPADDLYALGGVLFYLATCADPVVPEDGRPQRERLVRLLAQLRPDLPPAFHRIVGRLRALPEEQDVTLAEVEQALAVEVEVSEPAPVLPPMPEGAGAERYLNVARRVGDWLLKTERPAHPEYQWRPSEPGSTAVPVSIQYGSAGVGLFLADLYAATGDRRYLQAAERAANWCWEWVTQHPAFRTPGLMFGQGGIPWLLVSLARTTGRDEYLDKASAQARRLDEMDCPHLDFTHGLAGVGLVHIAVATATEDPYHLHRVREVADNLVEKAVPAAGGLLWESQMGPQPESFYGWGHGAAGIGYFLLEAARATGTGRYLEAALGAARALLASYEPVMDGEGWSWAHSRRNPVVWPHFCNGASGVGQFLIRLYDFTRETDLREAAERAAVAAAQGCRPTQTGLCHGIAGEGEFLIDMFQVTGDRRFLSGAADLAELLDARTFAVDDTLLWETDGTPLARADYMVGSSGIGHFHLRLALPQRFARAVTLPPGRRALVAR